jgi:hypothetical protein
VEAAYVLLSKKIRYNYVKNGSKQGAGKVDYINSVVKLEPGSRRRVAGAGEQEKGSWSRGAGEG